MMKDQAEPNRSRWAMARPMVVLVACLAFAQSIALADRRQPAKPDSEQPPAAGVTVQTAPVHLERRTFDRKHPPRDMPALHPDEAAVTSSNFSCAAQVSYVTTQHGAKREAHIDAVTMNTNLAITIWLPSTGNTPKLAAHEEGHKQIAQTCYQQADRVARQVGAALVGRQFDLSGLDERAAAKVINDAAQDACQQYMRQVGQWSSQVNAKYDELTDHGLNKLDEQKAVEQAFADIDEAAQSPHEPAPESARQPAHESAHNRDASRIVIRPWSGRPSR